MRSEALLEAVSRRRRAARRVLFERHVKLCPGWRILDIGCGESFRAPWFTKEYEVVGLDLREIARTELPYRKFVRGDAAKLPFPNDCFDFAYSNSLIEHLPTRELQHQFASEVSRVSKYYWVQTPDIRFPIDPHYLIPFFQHFPRKFQEAVSYRISGT